MPARPTFGRSTQLVPMLLVCAVLAASCALVGGDGDASAQPSAGIGRPAVATEHADAISGAAASRTEPMPQSSPGASVGDDGASSGDTTEPTAPDDRPNIVMVYVDDMRASDLRVMTTVNRRIAEVGTSFANSVVATANCCPSRATHLTGRFGHNTGVLHNAPPYGSYEALRSGLAADGATLPTWLRRAGYRTMFIGKYLNRFPSADSPWEVPQGFTDFYGLYEGSVRGTEHNIYRQTRYALRERPAAGSRSLLEVDRAREVVTAPDGDGHLLVYEGTGNHQTEVLMDAAVAAVDRDDGAVPLYLNVWLTAPHAGPDGPKTGGGDYPRAFRDLTVRPPGQELRRLETVLERGDSLGDYRLERGAAFNEADIADKPAPFGDAPRLTGREVADVEVRNALRLAALQGVDRRVDDLLTAVDRADRRTGRDTYVVFTSDNGFFLGEQRQPYQKNWHYRAASDVPLVVRGPGVAAGAQVDAPVANTDLAPTLLDLAGADGPVAALDGRSLRPLLQQPDRADGRSRWRDRAVLLEGFYGNSKQRRYAALRSQRYLYAEHYEKSDGATVFFRELYDLRDDPDVEDNLLVPRASNADEATARDLAEQLDRLRACAGRACRSGVDRTR